ncbi:MAG: hypothetical protein ABJL44_17170 [Algibacter sp.]
MKKNQDSKINTKHVFLKNNKVFTKMSTDDTVWFPINFQWMPMIELQKQMNL